MVNAPVLPIASATVILVFALLVFLRYRRRGGPHLLLWSLGLAMFGVGSLAEAYAALGWHPVVFRLWYLGGAILNAAWMGQGTVYLLSGQRMGNLLLALLLGYVAAGALFVSLAAPLHLTRGAVAALIAFHGIIFTAAFYRRLVRRWATRRATAVLTVLLAAGSLAAAYLTFTLPLDASAFDPGRTLSAQYREILPRGAVVRRFTPVFNIYGTITLVGGALYSAWLFWRKQIEPNRVLGNVLIAAGALAIAGASTMVRLGLADYLYLAELVSAVLMFGGFLLATLRSHPATQPVLGQVEGRA